MVSIGKLASGQHTYYLEQANGRVDRATGIASGAEDYYLGGPEATGYWVGDGARSLRLACDVDELQLRRVLAGEHPANGAVLRRWGTVPGFDVTFSAPKSVSILFGIGDATVQDAVRRAHDYAVAEALAYLERQAAVARRGHGGLESVEGEGLVAAAFRHRTSRAGDPQLHTHVLVANLVRGVDGRWSALDGRRLYAHAKTTSYLYQATLRAELTRTLGIEWTPVRRGIADIAGMPPAVLRAFSRRRAEIEAALERRNAASASAAQVAALDTRRAKDRDVTPERLAPEWKERAAALGLTEAEVARLLHRREVERPDAGAIERASAIVAAPAGPLTGDRSSFTRREVVQAFCEHLPVGATVSDIEAASDALLHSDCAVPLVGSIGDARAAAELSRERHYSTAELLALERRILDGAVTGRGAGAGRAHPDVVDAVLSADATLSDEQRSMVRRLVADGDRVALVVGRAGSGKTYGLRAAAAAWHASGTPVVGAAIARRAAHELEQGAGIPATSVHALLHDLDRGAEWRLAPGSVVVVDEAGMLPTRPLAQLLEHVEAANGKLVLVGDHHQLPELAAGGVFRGLAIRGHAIELVENRRQQERWERAATDLLRSGRSAEAVELYREHGRLVVASERDVLLQRMLGDWQAADDPMGAVMIAHRRFDVAELNGRARAVRRLAGKLGDAELPLPGGNFAVGDVVVVKRNHRRLGVRNGERGTVATVDMRTGELELQLPNRVVHLDRAFLEASTDRGEPSLRHGYAVTAYIAQGMTCRQALVLASDQLTREWGYTTLTRGRDGNRLYLVAPESGDRDEYAPIERQRYDPVDDLIDALERSEAQTLAHDTVMRNAIVAAPSDELRAQLNRLQGTSAGRREANQLQAVMADRMRAEHEHARAREDREVQSRIAGRWRRKTGGAQLARARAVEQLAAERAERLRSMEQRLRLATAPSQDPDDIARRALIHEELSRRTCLHARAAVLAPPAYVVEGLRPRPEAPGQRRQWDRAVRSIEHYRAEFGVVDTRTLLGPEPKDPAQRIAWSEASREVQQATRVIERQLELIPGAGRDLG